MSRGTTLQGPRITVAEKRQQVLDNLIGTINKAIDGVDCGPIYVDIPASIAKTMEDSDLHQVPPCLALAFKNYRAAGYTVSVVQAVDSRHEPLPDKYQVKVSWSL